MSLRSLVLIFVVLCFGGCAPDSWQTYDASTMGVQSKSVDINALPVLKEERAKVKRVRIVALQVTGENPWLCKETLGLQGNSDVSCRRQLPASILCVRMPWDDVLVRFSTTGEHTIKILAQNDWSGVPPKECTKENYIALFVPFTGSF